MYIYSSIVPIYGGSGWFFKPRPLTTHPIGVGGGTSFAQNFWCLPPNPVMSQPRIGGKTGLSHNGLGKTKVWYEGTNRFWSPPESTSESP